LLKLGEIESCFRYYHEAEYLFKECPDLSELAHLYLNLAKAYKDAGNRDKYESYASTAAAYYDMLGDQHDSDRTREIT